MRKTLLSHSIIVAALLGLTGLATADDKMKSESSGSSAATQDSGTSGAQADQSATPSGAGAAGPKGDAMKDCPPGKSSDSGSSSGAAGRLGQETSDRTPQPAQSDPPRQSDIEKLDHPATKDSSGSPQK